MQFNLQDINKLSLVNRIREWESKGFECAVPIQTVRSMKKNWFYKDNTYQSNKYECTSERVIYKTRMRRVKHEQSG